MSTDALIMLRRNVKHMTRNPVTVFNAVLHGGQAAAVRSDLQWPE